MNTSTRNNVFVLLAAVIIWGSVSIVNATHIFTTSVEDVIETMISSSSECCEFNGTTSGQAAIREDMLFITDGIHDIGASGANRPDDVFINGAITTGPGSSFSGATTTGPLTVNGAATINGALDLNGAIDVGIRSIVYKNYNQLIKYMEKSGIL